MKKRIYFLIFIVGILFLALISSREFIPSAYATGGAFPNTKHGGGTVDGIPFAGVNRAINPDFSIYYSDSDVNAGEYKSGECAHCHEPHSSFGGAEPPPSGSVAQNYLLLMGNDANICWYCHENMSLGMPPNPFGYGYWGFYQGQTSFLSSSHGQSPNFQWPGDNDLSEGSTVNPSTSWPRDRGAGALKPPVNTCINCHTPHGVAGRNYDTGVAPSSGNYTVSGAADSTVIDRQLIAREESLCTNCHDGSPSTTGNVKKQVDKYLLTAGSGHPVRKSAYYGRHDLVNEDETKRVSGWFTSATSHSECMDCHNPHRVQGLGTGLDNGTVFQISQNSGTVPGWDNSRYTTPNNSSSSQVKLGPVNVGVWGVNVNTATGAITNADVIPNLTTDDKVYNLCFKCHSAWAWGAATGTGSAIIAPSTDSTLSKAFSNTSMMSNYYLTDVAAEFATSNRSYHPVFASGKNRPELVTATNPVAVRNPCWCAGTACPPTVTSYTTNNEGLYGDGTCAAGGGDVNGTGKAIGARVDLTGSMEATLSQTFVPPWLHTSMITCVDCHVDSEGDSSVQTPRGPHGSDRPFILRKVDTTIRYDVCSAANCGGAPTTKTYASIAGELDETIMCWNCHRADVYSAGTYAGTNYASFARQTHPTHGSTNAGLLNTDLSATSIPRGISCLGCHGAGGLVGGNPADCNNANCKLGNIHGNNYDMAGDGLNNRLLAPAGNWRGFVRGVVGTPGKCNRALQANVAGWSGCSQHGVSTADFAGVANYNYTE